MTAKESTNQLQDSAKDSCDLPQNHEDYHDKTAHKLIDAFYKQMKNTVPKPNNSYLSAETVKS